MFLGIPQFPHFRDLNDILFIQSEIQSVQNVQLIKDSINIRTSDGEETQQKKNRSLKLLIKREQVSFEEGFMNEHIQTFKIQMQKYLESIFGRQKISVKTFKDEELFPKKEKVYTQTKAIEYYLNSHFCNLQFKRAELFMKDIQCEQKLKCFLTFVCQNCCHEVAGELLVIANEIWQQYVQIQENQFQYQQLIDKSKQACQRIKKKLQNYKEAKYMTLENAYLQTQKSKQQILKLLTEFIQYFATTIFLVTSQYFHNPYSEKQHEKSLKRNIFFGHGNTFDQFSDFQDEEQLYGRKKINLD